MPKKMNDYEKAYPMRAALIAVGITEQLMAERIAARFDDDARKAKGLKPLKDDEERLSIDQAVKLLGAAGTEKSSVEQKIVWSWGGKNRPDTEKNSA